MLTKRIIPCLDVNNGRTVKGTNFVNLRDAGDPVELAARYSDEGADELVFLDISATLEERGTFLKLVERIARAIDIPFAVGGGIRTTDDIARVLDAGADKVALNSAIVRRPELLEEAAACVGAQSIVAAIDAKRVGAMWLVFTKSGTERTSRNAVDWAEEAVRRGAGELLVTSMDRDGTLTGYDVELLGSIATRVRVPLIASGGAGTKEHMLEAFLRGNADAVLAASIFHFGTYSIREVKEFLSFNNVPVR
ncbi:MAG: imidazole glycerol phosphate synthase subunit HisF [Ignavibacteriales bacterium]|nr:imidazole glycerol phosphate synthase subunit HisF [Ignavibacteriales bacterium]